jgi:hypothetical protein
MSSPFIFNYNLFVALEAKLYKTRVMLKAFFGALVDIELSLIGF